MSTPYNKQFSLYLFARSKRDPVYWQSQFQKSLMKEQKNLLH